MPAPRSLYDVLNVAPEAEPVVVEAAYKALIKKYHPDQAVEAPVSKDATAINEAFAILKDPAKRADYDHRLWTKQQALRLAELQVGQRRPAAALRRGQRLADRRPARRRARRRRAWARASVPPRLSAIAEAAEVHDLEAPARAAAAKAAAAEAASRPGAMPSSARGDRPGPRRGGVAPAARSDPARAPRRAAPRAPRSRKARPGRPRPDRAPPGKAISSSARAISTDMPPHAVRAQGGRIHLLQGTGQGFCGSPRSRRRIAVVAGGALDLRPSARSSPSCSPSPPGSHRR